MQNLYVENKTLMSQINYINGTTDHVEELETSIQLSGQLGRP